MRYKILCVGRRAQDPLLQAATDYETRLGRYAKVEVERLREAGARAEGAAILQRLPAESWVCALDERGAHLTTERLSDELSRLQHEGHRVVTFLIGGADGLDPTVVAKANRKLALSAFTLPHRLALVTLLEQLYRVHTIWRGEAYHRV